MKKCNCCKQSKELKDFKIDRLNTDNRSGTCKECYKNKALVRRNKKKAEAEMYGII